MMYGGMGMQPMMQGMPMQGMNWGAANFCMNESNGEGRRHKKKQCKLKKTVDIDLSQDKNGNSSASVSDNE